MIKHLNIKISGKVQGVGFRYSCQQEAKKQNIKGYVRNMPDGSVYIEAEGKEPNITNFFHWCQKGPSISKITGIEVSESQISEFKDFIVKH